MALTSFLQPSTIQAPPFTQLVYSAPHSAGSNHTLHFYLSHSQTNTDLGVGGSMAQPSTILTAFYSLHRIHEQGRTARPGIILCSQLFQTIGIRL